MEQASWVPASVDLDRPSAARMYDYYLGGSHNFAVDREAAKAVE
ncbi:SAM-dependent methyltransferase, partial [Saccharothrix coeruleofusca]